MLTYKFFEIREDGRYALLLSLPCFSGEEADFSDAVRMNRFYESAAEAMYRYAVSQKKEDVRRMCYFCRAEVDTNEDGVITVRLQISLRRTLFSGSCPTMRRELVHRWKDGVLLHKKSRKQKNNRHKQPKSSYIIL